MIRTTLLVSALVVAVMLFAPKVKFGPIVGMENSGGEIVYHHDVDDDGRADLRVTYRAVNGRLVAARVERSTLLPATNPVDSVQ